MRSIFFYTITLGFVCGVFLRSLFAFGIPEILLTLSLALACGVLVRVGSRRKESPLFIATLFLVFVSLGMLRMDTEARSDSVFDGYLSKEVQFESVIAREPEARATSIHLHVRPIIGGERVGERVLVTVDPFIYSESFQYGDVLRVAGEITRPEAFETDGGREFDYRGYLRAQGVRTVIYGGEVSQIREGDLSFMRWLFVWKGKFMDSLEDILPSPHSGLGEGILLGVKRALGEDLEEAFRKTGIIHIVVLSGYNILIVVTAMMYLLSYVCRSRTKMIFGLAWIVSFALLVGLSSTVVRASIMAALLTVAQATGRNYAVLRALMLAGVVMLLINPYLLVYDIGFQLSFVATLGLILFLSYIEKRLPFIPSFFGLRGIAGATIATQIAVLPLLLYQTGMLSLVSIVVNILVLPMVPVAMLLSFLTGIAGWVSAPLGEAVGLLAYGSLDYIIKLAEFFGNLPLSAKTISAFPFWVVVVAYALIALWYLVKVIGDDEIANDSASDSLEGWTIEEEKTPESKSDSGGSIPFR